MYQIPFAKQADIGRSARGFGIAETAAGLAGFRRKTIEEKKRIAYNGDAKV